MVNFYTDKKEFESELRNVIRLFIPFFNTEIFIGVYNCGNTGCRILIEKNETVYYPETIESDKDLLTFYKICLYKALSGFFNRDLPWGSLTGIRPTRLAYKYLEAYSDKSLVCATQFLKEKYLVSNKKAALMQKILKSQKGLLFNEKEYVNLYVHIPFCPSRCKYCSFTAFDAQKYGHLIEPYLDCLTKEIRDSKQIIQESGKKLLSVYIGGGTPTVLTATQLNKVLSAVDAKGQEFTVEAGRPDTINPDKLDVLKQNNVNRISVNPQTFCEKTLALIGRNHTADDTVKAFFIAKEYGFDINMDLIAGLPQEKTQDFDDTLNKATELNPENITIHTLSIKNGSVFFNFDRQFNPFTQKMTQSAQAKLLKNGYNPYYLYRQKNMTDNLENIGYCLNNKQSVFNITSMEETVTVLATGAGAITKTVNNGKIERLANLRDVNLYIAQFNERLTKKREFLRDFLSNPL